VPPGYAPAGYGYGYPPAPRTDGLAIAAMVCGIAGFVACGVPSLVGLVLGFVSRGRIKRSNGMLTGSGMALTGIILGFVWIVLGLLYLVFIVILASSDSLE
jgi:hypothetical protein